MVPAALAVLADDCQAPSVPLEFVLEVIFPLVAAPGCEAAGTVFAPGMAGVAVCGGAAPL